jgi:hypothetical protein
MAHGRRPCKNKLGGRPIFLIGAVGRFMLDININPFKELVNGFAWCLTLGQADTEHIKGEIEIS